MKTKEEMTTDEIIELGGKLGIPFNRNDNYEDQLEKNIVVFNGVNNQRFLIDGNYSDDEILGRMGDALISMGERKKCMEINRVLSIM
jgi:hypothetical protein